MHMKFRRKKNLKKKNCGKVALDWVLTTGLLRKPDGPVVLMIFWAQHTLLQRL